MASQPGSDDRFRVAVFAAPDETSELGGVLERVLGMHPTDAAVHARMAPGVFPDCLPREPAERLAREIGQLGLQAEAVPSTQVPELTDAVVHHLRVLDGGLEIFDVEGREQGVVPWHAVALISVGFVPQETSRHYVAAEGTSIRPGRWTGPSTVEVPLPPGAEAWIIFENPAYAVRVDHKRMNYEYLGTRKSDSATANFRLFIDDVIARAPQVYLTPATRAWLEHGSIHDYSFETPERLERYTVLHLLIHRRAATPPT